MCFFVTALNFFNVRQQLHKFDPSYWRGLGEQLQVPGYKLNEIAAEIAGKPHGQQEALSKVLDFWLKNDLSATWQKLVKAVELCEDRDTARNIRSYANIPTQPGNGQLRCITNSIHVLFKLVMKSEDDTILA